jgi:hypothetical protein
MTMKRNLIILIATLPVLGIVWHLCSSGPQKPQVSAVNSGTLSQAKREHQSSEKMDEQTSPGNGTLEQSPARRNSSPYEENARRNEYQDRVKSSKAWIAQQHAEHAKAVENFDPTDGYRGIDRLMQKRDPRYRELFASWNFEDSKIREILGIIREREKNLLDELVRRMRETSAEAGDFKDLKRVNASLDKAEAKWESAQVVAELHLLPILGRERYEQLVELEARMRAGEKTQRD